MILFVPQRIVPLGELLMGQAAVCMDRQPLAYDKLDAAALPHRLEAIGWRLVARKRADRTRFPRP